MIERALRRRFAHYHPGPLGLFGLGLLTYTLVNVTWVFFRAKDFTTARRVLTGMLGGNGAAAPILPTVFLVAVGTVVPLIVAAHWYMRSRTLESVVARMPASAIALVWGLMAFLIVIAQGTGNAFIYFQF